MTDSSQPRHDVFHNPLAPDSADPWISYHDGYYYFTCTGGPRIAIRRAASLVDLYDAEAITVWQDDAATRWGEMWAPEMYRLAGPDGRERWYLYYCASDGWHINHRCHVLESTSDTPMGPYVYKGRLATDHCNALYAIDASVLRLPDGRMHFLWAGHPDHRIFIADMENPWTTRGSRVLLEADGFGCSEVREGPVTLVRQGQVFLIYSICDTAKPNYKLGMLIASETADLLDPASWKQHPEPVFVRADENGVYGPGHNGFFKSPDGTEDWIVYHAKTTPIYTYRTRTARAQRFTWRPDGTPDFGKPLPLDAVIPLPSGDPGGTAAPVFAPPETKN